MATKTVPVTTLTATSSAVTTSEKDFSWLGASNLRLLEVICDTLIPALDVPPASDPTGLLRRPASAMQVAQRMAETLTDEDKVTRQEFRQLLGLIRGRAGGLLLLGRPISFEKMDPEMRERALRSMENSGIPKLRQGFQAIKRLAAFIFYSAPAPDGSDNLNWAAVGFAPPAAPPQVAKPIHPLEITATTTLDADVVIVGSGAGGGVMAAELAKAGKSVIVLEKGGYYNESDFTGREAEMMPEVYLKRGLQSTRDLSMLILAGSCLGGGTVVNWSTSFRAPAEVLHEWEHDYGLTGFSGSEFLQHYDAVSGRIGVNMEHSQSANLNNKMIEKGSAKLGYHWAPIPSNANHCDQRCGGCGYGCAFGRKQSTLLTYLQDASDNGARFIVNCSVDRVLIEQGTATGVVATVKNPQTGVTRQVTVRAKRVVIAAGSLHSPAILLRSGIKNAQLGRNLHLHPVMSVMGFYDEPIYPWIGSLQTRYSDQFSHEEGTYGFKVEAVPAHPGLIGITLPWESGRQHKEYMLRSAYAAPLIALVRDKVGGKVTLDKQGEPLVDYTLGDYERRMLIKGAVEVARIHLAAGAKQVGTLHNLLTTMEASSDGLISDSQLATFERIVQERGLEPNRVVLGSAHQMGTCRMAADPQRGVIGNDNQVFGVSNLYVADASTFPTATGVNPMLTILAIAHRAAQAIKATL